MKNKLITIGLLTAALLLTGCTKQGESSQTSEQTSSQTSEQTSSQTSEQTTSQATEQTTTEQTTESAQTESQPEESTPAESGTVSVKWLEDYGELVEGEYTAFVADESDSQAQIVLTANGDVSNFKLLNLSYSDIDEDGNIIFDITEAYSAETLAAGKPLVCTLTFIGSIPNYGISYDTADGTVRYSLCVSGMDGSLFLSEF